MRPWMQEPWYLDEVADRNAARRALYDAALIVCARSHDFTCTCSAACTGCGLPRGADGTGPLCTYCAELEHLQCRERHLRVRSAVAITLSIALIAASVVLAAFSWGALR